MIDKSTIIEFTRQIHLQSMFCFFVLKKVYIIYMVVRIDKTKYNAMVYNFFIRFGREGVPIVYYTSICIMSFIQHNP
jgi:hypothetical protein